MQSMKGHHLTLPMALIGTPGPHCLMPSINASLVTSESQRTREVGSPAKNIVDVSP
jgi:hypothetical protein